MKDDPTRQPEGNIGDDVPTPRLDGGEERPPQTGRRQFLKKAAVTTAPVILTVASRPAWGHICAPSGMVSGNLSHPEGNTEECVADVGPNEYADGLPWPAAIDDNAYFDVVFDAVGVAPHAKLKQIINSKNDDGSWKYGDFERASVAALLNAASGLMFYLGPNPEFMVICMVHDVLVNGVYMAAPGCPWDQNQLLAYFLLTFYGPWV